MKCGYSEQTLALYIQEDLPDSSRHEVERHVASCARCRLRIDELREIRSNLELLRGDTVSSAALASTLSNVRRRVWNDLETLDASADWALQMERALFAGLRRKYVLAGLAVGGIAVLLFSATWQFKQHGNPATTGRAQIATALSPNPAIVAAENVRDVTPHRTSRQPRETSQEVANPVHKPDEILMELQTDDPNVVIYWLADQRGE